MTQATTKSKLLTQHQFFHLSLSLRRYPPSSAGVWSWDQEHWLEQSRKKARAGPTFLRCLLQFLDQSAPSREVPWSGHIFPFRCM